LCAPGEDLRPGAIYNSNGALLEALATDMKLTPKDYGTVNDRSEAIESAVSSALSECDVVVLSGGVSMGDFDLVPEALKQCGVEVLFHGVAVKPGKPLLFGSVHPADPPPPTPRLSASQPADVGAAEGSDARNQAARYVFGIPGNPVSTFVAFEIFVKPLVYRLMGIDYEPLIVRARLAEDFERRDTDRLEYRPSRFDRGEIVPITYHGSSHLEALSRANAFFEIERGVGTIKEGAMLDARLL
jgi:molybdopterin molybdotransferase